MVSSCHKTAFILITSGGHPRSRKGLLAKGYKTRNPKKTTSKFIISKKKK